MVDDQEPVRDPHAGAHQVAAHPVALPDPDLAPLVVVGAQGRPVGGEGDAVQHRHLGRLPGPEAPVPAHGALRRIDGEEPAARPSLPAAAVQCRPSAARLSRPSDGCAPPSNSRQPRGRAIRHTRLPETAETPNSVRRASSVVSSTSDPAGQRSVVRETAAGRSPRAATAGRPTARRTRRAPGPSGRRPVRSRRPAGTRWTPSRAASTRSGGSSSGRRRCARPAPRRRSRTPSRPAPARPRARCRRSRRRSRGGCASSAPSSRRAGPAAAPPRSAG